MRLYRRLLFIAIPLAFAVIALGAYVRLSDAGLGCPDWPGCYGHWLGVPEAAHEQLTAQQLYPERPLNSAKAWKEMVHRYCAGTLGLLILALAVLAWTKDLRRVQSPLLPTLLLFIIGLQAALGMWTVSLLLKPVIVTLHLIGGMTTLSVLLALALKDGPVRHGYLIRPGLRWLAAGALLMVMVQIALGGWVSSNYAALACTDFPLCQGEWRPATDFSHAFSLHRELGLTTEGELLSSAALTAIHWTHRMGALGVALIVGALALAMLKTGARRWRIWGSVLLGLLLMQIGLGIANVLLSLPLALAVAHNLGAACLLTATLSINLQMHRQRRPAESGETMSPPKLQQADVAL